MSVRSTLLCATAVGLVPVGSVFAQVSSNATAAPAGESSLEEIVVTGTFVRSQIENASPISVATADDLAKQGAFTLGAIIDNLPINSGAQNNANGPGQPYTAGTSNVNLRGLGVSSTLVLLDGQRQVASAGANLEGDQFVDLSSLIPSIAINRVEILKDGASSLYGSDAVAGVVNFITQSNYRGLLVKVNDTLTTRDKHNEAQLEALAGFDAGPMRVVLAGSYFDRDFLSASERRGDFSKRASLSSFGFPQTFLVGGVLTPDPACRDAAATDPNVIPPAGPVGFCSFDFGDFFPLVAAEERALGYGRVAADVTDAITVFAQLNYAHNTAEGSGPPAPSVLFSPLLPATNPGNSFGVPVVLIGRPLGTSAGATPVDSTSETWRIATGLQGEFSENGGWAVTYVRARNRFDLSTVDTLQDRYVAALNGVGGPDNDQFFNPRFGAQNDPAVIDDFMGIYAFTARSELDTLDAHLTRTLFELPHGPLGIAVGYQHRRERLSYDYNADANAHRFALVLGGEDFEADQTINAGFVELSAPVIEGLELQAALRYEDFGDGVNTWDPKIGVLVQPLSTVSLRATYGTSFRAASLFQKNGTLVVPARVFDPVNNAQVTVSQRTGADPDNPLVPQTATTYNFGATWDADFGLNLSIDYWSFAYEDYITAQSPGEVVAAAPLGTQVIRTVANQIATVRTFFRNAGSLDTDGIDLSARFPLPQSEIGQFTALASATRVLSYDLTDPQRGKIDGLGNRNFLNFGVSSPKLRGNAGVEWTAGDHSANVFVRYIDSYRDDSDANYKIKAFTTVDVQYSLDLPPDFFAGITPAITVGCRNLFDEDAPDALDRTGYDPLVANALGRLVYASISAQF